MLLDILIHYFLFPPVFFEVDSVPFFVFEVNLPAGLSVDSGSPIDSKSFQYTPLLEQYENLFPNFKLHVDHIETPKVKKRGGKSPSPAGRFIDKT
jgi:hypothetical protein